MRGELSHGQTIGQWSSGHQTEAGRMDTRSSQTMTHDEHEDGTPQLIAQLNKQHSIFRSNNKSQLLISKTPHALQQ